MKFPAVPLFPALALLQALVAAGLAVEVRAAAPFVETKTVAEWIWADDSPSRSKVERFRKTFRLEEEIASAELRAVADFNAMNVFVNGKQVLQVEDFSPAITRDVLKELRTGENVIIVDSRSNDGPAAIALKLTVGFKNGEKQTIVTNATWQAAAGNRQAWTGAKSLGPLAEEPFGDRGRTIGITLLDDYTQWKQALGADAGTDPGAFSLPEGFEIELLRSAAKEEDSWVSMAFDPQGRLTIGKESQGLLRFTLPKRSGDAIQVETINDDLKECRGLLYAHGSLYANANNSKGMYRLRDSNGDDQFDEVKLLRTFSGGVGHGRNSLALGPDGMIYSIHGDSVDVPTDMINRTSPLREPRPEKQTREGCVVRTDRDGETWELVVAGLRNPYGIAFHPDGEMFTYDADAEYDTGSPWYRPTRVHHMLPGGDYGWRGVTKNWPPFYPDRPEAAPNDLDVGKGSPTSVAFGTNSAFPPKYQRALFLLDWAYGRIVAVHATPRGSSYAMRAEPFIKGRPLNVTALDFGPDGAMYFVTGGRKTQSGLYRVRYVRPTFKEDSRSAQQVAREQHAEAARKTRRELETFHGKQDEASPDAVIAAAWPRLGSSDPWLRHAARIAVEHQPVDAWRDRALREPQPLAALTALLALAQTKDSETALKIIQRLDRFPLKKLSLTEQLIALRIHELCLSRLPKIDRENTDRISRKWDALYPAEHPILNKRLCALLVRLQSPNVLPKTLALLAESTSQAEQLQFLLVLRDVRSGWTLDQRREYFTWIAKMKTFIGGEGMPTITARIKEDAMADLTDQERIAVAPILNVLDSPANDDAWASRKLVREWKTEELVQSLPRTKTGNRQRGEKMFAAARCSLCHRVGRLGAAVGPDLTAVARRFSRKDMLTSILDPSLVVAEKYRQDVVVTQSGQVITGRVVPTNDFRSPTLRIAADPLN
ncbi:MAG: hypothetical protein N2C14_29115, partial [Planctomycetales bacterium]